MQKLYGTDTYTCCGLNFLSLYFLSFEKASGIKIPYEIVGRRPGDPDEVYANADKAKKLLGWEATKTIDDMCRDTWRWQKNNPNGYGE